MVNLTLPDLIDLSEENDNIKKLLDISVEKIYGDRKPLTEILDEIKVKEDK